jgi:hypothetical protein
MPLWLFLALFILVGSFMWVGSRLAAKRKPRPPPDLGGFQRRHDDAP